MVSLGHVGAGGFFAVVGGVLLVGMVLFAGGLAANAWQAHQVEQRATPTEATVTNVSVSKHVDCADDRGDAGCDQSWRVRVTYTYAVDGERYRSSVIRTPGYRTDYRSFADRDDARAYADRYREGEQVRAHYDPTDPDAAFLEYGHPLSLDDLFVPLVVLAFGVVPLGFLGLGLVAVKEGLNR